MKRSVFFLISVMLIIGSSLVYAAGGGQQASGSQAAGGKPTIVMGMNANLNVTDYETNYLTQYLERLHDVNIDFYLLPADGNEGKTKLSLMVASNDLPDTIFTWLTDAEILDYGSKGAFIPLNKYVNDPAKAPNFTVIPARDKDLMLDSMTSSDGNIYGLAQFQPETWNLTPDRLYINRAWMTKLGLNVPTTTDELRNVLLAFRDQDPNGNGRRDEIGMFGWYEGGYGENVITAIINSFIYYHHVGLTLDASGNTVTAPFTDPAFRKALVYLNTLFRDGVLAADTFTTDQQGYRGLLNSTPAVVGITSAGSIGNWAGAGQQDNNENYRDMAPMLPPLTGPDGVSWARYNEYYPSNCAFITSKSANPDLAFAILESFYREDVSTIVRFGEEGADWSRKPEDLAKVTNDMVDAGLYPSLSLVQVHDIWTKPQNKHWGNNGPRYTPIEKGNTIGNLETPFDNRYFGSTHGAVNFRYYNPRHPEKLLPVLKYNINDALNIAEPQANVDEYVKQSIAEFATSARDINNDSQWNAYLRELDNMGLKVWLDAAQATYNRQRR
jgi:putative aldouronate transport system substrate-binding protein